MLAEARVLVVVLTDLEVEGTLEELTGLEVEGTLEELTGLDGCAPLISP